MIFDGSALLAVVHSGSAIETYQIDIATLQVEQIARLTHAKPEKMQRSQNFIFVEEKGKKVPIEIKTLKKGQALQDSIQFSSNDDLVIEQLGTEVRIHDLSNSSPEKKIMLKDYSCVADRMHATENQGSSNLRIGVTCDDSF